MTRDHNPVDFGPDPETAANLISHAGMTLDDAVTLCREDPDEAWERAEDAIDRTRAAEARAELDLTEEEAQSFFYGGPGGYPGQEPEAENEIEI